MIIGIASAYAYFAPAAGPLHMHGVTVGMSKTEVLNRLGRPATTDERTWMYYFGALAVGQEFLEVDFGPDKRVVAVSGEELSRGGQVIVDVGDSEAKITRMLGSVRKHVREKDFIRCYFEQVEVRLANDKVETITLR